MTVTYRVMGVLAIILTSATLVYGMQIWRDPAYPLDPAFRLAVVIGLVSTFFATVFIAGFMAAGSPLFVGGAGSDAGGLPIMGWSRDGGDLRVAHFFATHAMHGIPLAGFFVSRGLPAAPARIAVMFAAAAYLAFTLFTFVQALQGKPFL